MKKVLIAGIGGIGGFFGGKLADYYADTDTEIYFLSRGENLKEILRHGLKVHYENQHFVAHPRKISNDAADFGTVDLLICCTKSYHLEETLQQLRPCINIETVILPLQNGVDSFERTKALFPENEIWKGCVYIVSRLIKPGKVVDTGHLRRLFFGTSEAMSDKLIEAEKLFKSAGIDTQLSSNIEKTIWEKFSFISPLASATSYLDETIGQILENQQSTLLLRMLMEEFLSVAEAKGILLAADNIEKSLERMATLSFDTTSSMHSDLRSGNKIEVESLVAYILNEAVAHKLDCPAYRKVYEKLKS